MPEAVSGLQAQQESIEQPMLSKAGNPPGTSGLASSRTALTAPRRTALRRLETVVAEKQATHQTL
jgi:hypothetical protein